MDLVNTTYENGLISILLNANEDIIIEAASRLTLNDFYSKNILAAGLFEIIKKLTVDGREINPINIVAEAEKRKSILAALGGSEKAFETIEILKSVPVDVEEYDIYINEIKKYSVAREILKQSKNLEKKILNKVDVLTLDEVVNEPQKLFVDITTYNEENGIHMGEGLDLYVNTSKENIGVYPGFPSRWESITKTILSHQKGVLEVYFAPAYEGKSLFLLNEGDYLGNELLIPTLYIDTEMTQSQQQSRLLSIRTGIPYDDIKLKTALTDHYGKSKIEEQVNKIKNGKLYWVGLDYFDKETIERVVRYYIVKHGIEVLIFDYIKLPEVKSGLNETQQLGNLCIFLKNSIARKMNLNVISSAQADERERDRVADSQRIKRFVDILACWGKKLSEEMKAENYKNGRYALEFMKNRESFKLPRLNFDFNGDSSEIIEMDNSHVLGTAKSVEQPVLFQEEKKKKKEIKGRF